MNESRGARTMVDGTGHGLHGSIGREVGTGTTVSGSTGYRFERLEPDRPPARPGHIVTVPDHRALDPGDRTYVVTVRLRTVYHFGNIVQKGQATSAGGNFKLQIPSGRVECLFRGSRGSRAVFARTRINDGRWHTVECERGPEGVTLRIDGRTEARAYGWVGTIDNSWPLAIGGKVDCDQVDVGCDYYAGDIDRIDIGTR
ncbi:hypothetical protein GCM10009557_75450 [Virgisporangium ochraceum]|uniref:Laminin G domain-containing protein n=2 Tax=Virgisporangium ochraceum TaxID=65505 RepID=A0A8J3ZPI3_9ACTN|nr:hypothetical protein Voc01_023730 [Virgisporangium ochraceum]